MCVAQKACQYAGAADNNLISNLSDASTAAHMPTVCVCLCVFVKGSVSHIYRTGFGRAVMPQR